MAAGYAVVDQTAVLATHLGELIRQNAHELLTRQETKRLIDRLSESHPKLTEELVPKLMTLGEVSHELAARLCSIFTADAAGRRACHGEDARFADNPNWKDLVLFHEYFNGDSGKGHGANVMFDTLSDEAIDVIIRHATDKSSPLAIHSTKLNERPKMGSNSRRKCGLASRATISPDSSG